MKSDKNTVNLGIPRRAGTKHSESIYKFIYEYMYEIIYEFMYVSNYELYEFIYILYSYMNSNLIIYMNLRSRTHMS